MAKQGEKGRAGHEAQPGGKKLRTLRGALEHSLMIQYARLQETVDGFVARGKLSRDDADLLVRQLVTSGQAYTKALLEVADSAVADARRSVEGRVSSVVEGVVEGAGKMAGKVRRTAPARMAAAAAPVEEEAPAAASGGNPIPGYDSLTVPQVKPKLGGLNAAQLRAVRDHEQRGKARKGVLAEVDRLLGPQ